MTYIVVDIETCPIDIAAAQAMQNDEERQKLINPIDSKIVAIGIRSGKVNKVWCGDNERELIDEFWVELNSIKRGNPTVPIVGFNITNFDIPFIVTRSFINNVPIVPFTVKEIIDVREKINAYRYGPSKGRLKEFAQMLNLSIQDVDGGDVMDFCIAKQWEKIKEYNERDLELTDEMYARIVTLNISKIAKW